MGLRPWFVIALLVAAAPAVVDQATACSYVGLPDASLLAWDEQGRLLVNHGYDVGMLDLDASTVVLRASTFPNGEAVVSPDGRFLAVSAGAREPRPDAQEAACELPYGGVQVLDLESGEVTQLFEGASPALATSVRFLYAVSPEGDEVRRYDWHALGNVFTTRLGGGSPDAHVGRMVVTRDDGRLALTRSSGERAEVVTMGRFGNDQDRIAIEGRPAGLALSPRGDQLAVSLRAQAGGEEGTVHLYDLATDGHAITSFSADVTCAGFGGCAGLAWGPAGLAFVDGAAIVLLPDADRPQERRTFGPESMPNGGLAWSQDGRLLAIGTEDKLLVVDEHFELIGQFDLTGEDRFERDLVDPPGAMPAGAEGADESPLPAWALACAAGIALLFLRSRP